MIIVPIDSLSPAALEGAVEAFILREGTDYGHADMSLHDKREQVLAQLRSGHAQLVYLPEEEYIDIQPV